MTFSHIQLPKLQCQVQVVHQKGIKCNEMIKSCQIELGRNACQQMILKCSSASTATKVFELPKTPRVLKKFWRDGKATIELPEQKLSIMIGNCPPDSLMTFIKALHAKTKKKVYFASNTDKMQCLLKSGSLGRIDEISPLTSIELSNLHTKQQCASTPTSKLIKRPNTTPTSSRNAVNGKCLKLDFSPGSQKPAAPSIRLTSEQCSVLAIIRSGQNIFFTGSAGTGKSFLLQRIIGTLPPQSTAVTASTGIAASHIGGTTLHSFAGIGSGKGTLEEIARLVDRPKISQNWKRIQHLIIDEISMVEASFFDKLDFIAKRVRRSDKPFGGIQLILCGDFFQLPPVTKGHSSTEQDYLFAFQSRVWPLAISTTMVLSVVQRQSGDRAFVKLLEELRWGNCSEAAARVLMGTASTSLVDTSLGGHVSEATRLCSHNDAVNAINTARLEELSGKPRVYTAIDLVNGTQAPNNSATTKALDQVLPVSCSITLKVGAQVMLVKNLSVSDNFVNGSRGVITGFSTASNTVTNAVYPVVRFFGNKSLRTEHTRTVTPEKFFLHQTTAGGQQILTRLQLPLRLGWAVSIHKSQGMTLDRLEMSLSRIFEAGQAYVALSRAKSLEGLKVTDFDPSCVRANPAVIQFYKDIYDTQTSTSSTSYS